MAERIPVTVLTGYLGAGKTTLLNRILSEDHGRRYAVIVNEFGAVGIDNDLILKADEELFEMNNGCICCTVRGDLIRTMHGLLSRTANFDAIIVETTGLADPGPVAQTFFVDPFLQEKTVLDSVTTVVDARHILLRLHDSREAVEQVAFADQMVLNKTELATEEELGRIEARLRRLNPLAPIHRAQRANVSLDKVLGRGGFDIGRIVSLEPDFLRPAQCEAGHVHDEHCGHAHEGHHGHGHEDHHDHEHDAGIRSIALTCALPMNGERIGMWLNALVNSKGEDILRAKGIIDVKDEKRRLVFQSVHMLLEGDLQREWQAGEARYSRIVFIGRNLDEHMLRKGFESCAAPAAGPGA
ncbi:CobW family GTP-binding protein [Massilia niastensis]|uniref:CobW family GTP-binding protein n=1 Tax=Massilia niastensis TaxID=544911 RepID=UPI0003666FFB|nr:GTP-binding protein [Massilia niastensis]